MTTWLDALTAQSNPAVLVTVAVVDGSAPREPGAKMLVTQKAQFDTIGGGHLEWRATEIARDMLAAATVCHRLERFPLGPSLGQCCGGVVQLAFEYIDDRSRGYLAHLAQQWHRREDSWRVIALDGEAHAVLLDRDGRRISGSGIAGSDVQIAIDQAHATHLVRDAQDRRWLVDPCLAFRPHLVLFGAGHVGAAIVRALAALPCHVTWVDERDDVFPANLPANVKVEATDVPEAAVDDASSGSSFLVMTHSHALDLRLAECILRRDDSGWFGLIGSKTKRMQFEHRLRERGVAPSRLADMVCPIGLPDIKGKEPAVIAASVVAQLLQVWEGTALAKNRAAAAAMELQQSPFAEEKVS